MQGKRGLNWSQEERTKLWDMHEAGVSHVKIAETLGRSLSAIEGEIYRTRTEHQTNRTARFWTDARKDELLALYDQGMSIEDICAHFNKRRSVILERLRKTKMERKRSDVSRHRNVVDDLATEVLPPLTDWPKHPGKQCGYCPCFLNARIAKTGEIIGQCTVQNTEVSRSQFCTADSEPIQWQKYPVTSIKDWKLMYVVNVMGGPLYDE